MESVDGEEGSEQGGEKTSNFQYLSWRLAMVLVEVEDDAVGYHEMLETKHVQAQNPNIKYYVRNTSPGWEISIEDRVRLDRFFLVCQKQAHENNDSHKNTHPQSEDECVFASSFALLGQAS